MRDATRRLAALERLKSPAPRLPEWNASLAREVRFIFTSESCRDTAISLWQSDPDAIRWAWSDEFGVARVPLESIVAAFPQGALC